MSNVFWWLAPAISLVIAICSYVQLMLAKRVMSSTTILSLEQHFWVHFKETYIRFERGEYDHLKLDELNSDIELCAHIESYANFFNTLGVLVQLGTLSRKVAFSVFPYRIHQVVTNPLVAAMVKKNEKAWQGLIFFENDINNRQTSFTKAFESIKRDKEIAAIKSKNE